MVFHVITNSLEFESKTFFSHVFVTAYLNSRTLIRKWRTEERCDDVHDDNRDVVLQRLVGVLRVMRRITNLEKIQRAEGGE